MSEHMLMAALILFLIVASITMLVMAIAMVLAVRDRL